MLQSVRRTDVEDHRAHGLAPRTSRTLCGQFIGLTWCYLGTDEMPISCARCLASYEREPRVSHEEYYA